MKNIKPILSYNYFKKRKKEVENKLGNEILTDDDLFILACDKLFHSYTYEEIDYTEQKHD